MLCFNFAVYSDDCDEVARGDRYSPERIENPFPCYIAAWRLMDVPPDISQDLHLIRWFLVTADPSRGRLCVENVYAGPYPEGTELQASDSRSFFTAEGLGLPQMPDRVLVDGGDEPTFAATHVQDKHGWMAVGISYGKTLLAEPWAQASVHGPRSAKLFYFTRHTDNICYPSPGICGEMNLVAAVVDWDHSRPRTKADFILRLEIPQA